MEQLQLEQIRYHTRYAQYQESQRLQQSYPTEELNAEYQKYMACEEALKSNKLSVPVLSSNYDIVSAFVSYT